MENARSEEDPGLPSYSLCGAAGRTFTTADQAGAGEAVDVIKLTLGVLAALIVGGMAVYAVADWLRGMRWGASFKRIPASARDAWEHHWSVFSVASVLLVIGAPGVYLAFTRYAHQDIQTADQASIQGSILSAVVSVVFIVGGIFLAAAIVGFLHHTFTGGRRSSGLDTVYDQGVHDTGDFASEAEIDAALRDDGGALAELEFEE